MKDIKKKCEYVNNADLRDLIILYRQRPDDQVAGNELAKAFLIMAAEVYRWQKITKIEEDQAVNDAAWVCLEKAKGQFDISRKNAFAYFTTVIVNYFRQVIRQKNSYNRLITEYTKETARRNGVHSISEADDERQ